MRSLAEPAQTRYLLPRAVTRCGFFANATVATRAKSVHATAHRVLGVWLCAYIVGAWQWAPVGQLWI
jgi:hypothetical protein